MKKNSKRGFTLIELLVVVAIIGILASVVLASLNSARSKGNDAAVQSNLKNAVGQGEIFWNTNTAAVNSYANVCTNGTVGGALGVGSFVTVAAKASGLSGSPNYATGAIGTTTTATCNSSASAWAAEVPLTSKGASQMWCVDSTGKSRQETGTSLTTATTTACN
jgi:prepilin-type N-terminal cleavage/methylation domain-containing protein